MLARKTVAIIAALLLATSGASFAEDSAESAARNKADWEWQREQSKQRQYEQRKQEETSRNSNQESDSSCGLGCKLFLGAAALVIGCAAGVICNDKKPAEPDARPSTGAGR